MTNETRYQACPVIHSISMSIKYKNENSLSFFLMYPLAEIETAYTSMSLSKSIFENVFFSNGSTWPS